MQTGQGGEKLGQPRARYLPAPKANLPTYRLISVHRLRKPGVSFEQLTEDLRIPAGHTCHLYHRRVYMPRRGGHDHGAWGSFPRPLATTGAEGGGTTGPMSP